MGNNQVPVPGLHGPRQLSVDIDKGVVILEVPDKTNQGTMWKFLSHYSGVLRKYFGLNKVEAEARVRANSGIGMWFKFLVAKATLDLALSICLTVHLFVGNGILIKSHQLTLIVNQLSS